MINMEWNFEEYGFKLKWSFPEDDEPHCEVLLRLNTGWVRKDDETYSLSGGTPLPCKDELEILKNLRKSIDMAIEEIKEINRT